MRRIVIRPPGFPFATVALAIGIGTAAGVLLGEALASADAGTTRRPTYRKAVRVVRRAQAALDADVPLRDFRLRVIPAAPGQIELHGWVDARRDRARAARTVSAVVDAVVVNCIGVHGEDDDLPGIAAVADERLG